jgi:hypothetical protein
MPDITNRISENGLKHRLSAFRTRFVCRKNQLRRHFLINADWLIRVAGRLEKTPELSLRGFV